MIQSRQLHLCLRWVLQIDTWAGFLLNLPGLLHLLFKMEVDNLTESPVFTF